MLIALGILNLILLIVIADSAYRVRWYARSDYEDRLARVRNEEQARQGAFRRSVPRPSREAANPALEEDAVRPQPLTWGKPVAIRTAVGWVPVQESDE